MSDGSLSQDEIEALLQGADDVIPDGGGAASVASGGGGGGSLTESQKATFMDIVNVTAENHAQNLSIISTKTAKITGLNLKTGSADDLKASVSGSCIEAKIAYSGSSLNGSVHFFIPSDEAAKIAGFMMGQEDIELNDVAIDALREAFSQMTGATDSAINGKYGGDFTANQPEISNREDPSSISVSSPELAIVTGKMSLEGIGDNINYVMAYEMPLVKGYLSVITGGGDDDIMGMSGGDSASDLDSLIGGDSGGGVGISNAEFGQLEPAANVQATGNIGLLMDVTMKLTVELGRTTMTIRDILSLGEGSIIELDKLAGEPVDLLVNNKLIAKGEVVVIDENFGVRVTDIIDPKDRLSKSQDY